MTREERADTSMPSTVQVRSGQTGGIDDSVLPVGHDTDSEESPRHTLSRDDYPQSTYNHRARPSDKDEVRYQRPSDRGRIGNETAGSTRVPGLHGRASWEGSPLRDTREPSTDSYYTPSRYGTYPQSGPHNTQGSGRPTKPSREVNVVALERERAKRNAESHDKRRRDYSPVSGFTNDNERGSVATSRSSSPDRDSLRSRTRYDLGKIGARLARHRSGSGSHTSGSRGSVDELDLVHEEREKRRERKASVKMSSGRGQSGYDDFVNVAASLVGYGLEFLKDVKARRVEHSGGDQSRGGKWSR